MAGQLPEAPPDFTDPATIRDQTPTAWYDVINNGRLDKLMPPWNGSLSEQERWDVALYSYTLSYQSDAIAQGQQIWAANCAQCHGENGRGNPAGQTDGGDVTGQELLAGLSDTALFDAISQGTANMPAFADTLTEDERWNVIAYNRTLSLASVEGIGSEAPPSAPLTTPEVAPATTPEVEVASAAEVVGSVSGKVENGSAGAPIPPDLTVTLHIYDSQFNEQTSEDSQTAQDGTFHFDDVLIRNDQMYTVTTSYGDRTFGSEIVPGDTAAPDVELPFTIYDVTDDPAGIAISSIAIQMAVVSNQLQVVEIVNFVNTSDRVYTRSEPSSPNGSASVTIALPPGAQVTHTTDTGQDSLVSPDGLTFIDTRPVFPGQDHVVHVIYTLPYNGSADFSLPVNYTLNGPVQLWLSPESFNVTSAQLPSLGTQDAGDTTFKTYGASLSLNPSESLRYQVSGDTTSSQTGALPTNSLLAYVLIALGGGAILASAIIFRFGDRLTLGKKGQVGGDAANMLVGQIAVLDELHEAGKIDEETYQQRRNALKERLGKLIK